MTPPLAHPLAHVVLVAPEIPHNTGAIGRTCVAVGAKLWLVKPLGFSLDDYYVRRAGLDYWEHLDWELVDRWEDIPLRLPRAPWLFSKGGRQDYRDAAFEVGDTLVFGAESSGLPPALLASQPERTLRIPMRSEVRSLNLSNAAAIVLYDIVRRSNALR